MASLAAGAPRGLSAGVELRFRWIGGVLVALATITAVADAVAAYSGPAAFGLGPLHWTDQPPVVAAFGLGLALMLAGALLMVRSGGVGGALGIAGALIWIGAFLWAGSFAWLLAFPGIAGLIGGVLALAGNDWRRTGMESRLVYRQSIFTRLTHWAWAIALFFLLVSGLQIFNARPNLYVGQESGFGFSNDILTIGAENTPNGPRGFTNVLGSKFDTTGVLGMSGSATRPAFTAFPGWATIPSFRDLATGRVIHFFFAWVLVITLAVWLVASLVNRHLWRDIILKPRDLRELPRDIVSHLTFRFRHGRTYTPLQKLAYFVMFVILFPLMILTGLTMSPGVDSGWGWLVDIFGGRQTARTIHFLTMMAIVVFFVVHVAMVVLAGPFNELRSMITGYYRMSPGHREDE
jgi:thiosulfate reductase cytochrome b subunit